METKDKKEKIKEAFLLNIGRVIRRNRNRKGLKGEGLALDAGITQPEISRYESGKADIPASKMAYIADALDFDLMEYTINIDTEKRMSQIFKELIAAGAQPSSPQPVSKQIRPKYDRTDLEGNVIPTLSIQRPKKDNTLEPPSELDDKMFDEYLSGDETADKANLLSMSYMFMLRDTKTDAKDIKIAIRAITRYVASDADRETNKRLQEYLKRCQSIYTRTHNYIQHHSADNDGGI